MNGPNDLAQWLAFYDKNVGQDGPNPLSFVSGLSPDPNRGQGKLLWAMNMMRNEGRAQPRDFFGELGNTPQGPAYVQPREVDMNAQRPMPALRTDYFDNDPMRNDAENYLARLLGSRRMSYTGAR